MAEGLLEGIPVVMAERPLPKRSPSFSLPNRLIIHPEVWLALQGKVVVRWLMWHLDDSRKARLASRFNG